MLQKIISKILVAAILIFTLFSYADCKKQDRCGCNGTVKQVLADDQAYVYFNSDGTNIQFTLLTDPYATYYFCNPQEMFPKFKNWKSGDVLLVSGNCFWDCTYMMNASNYSYSYTMNYRVYQVKVTDVRVNLFGK
jgi:hypothetical protein